MISDIEYHDYIERDYISKKDDEIESLKHRFALYISKVIDIYANDKTPITRELNYALWDLCDLADLNQEMDVLDKIQVHIKSI